MSGLNYGKKLALELEVSMDELISDEDVNDIQVNYGIWKSQRTFRFVCAIYKIKKAETHENHNFDSITGRVRFALPVAFITAYIHNFDFYQILD